MIEVIGDRGDSGNVIYFAISKRWDLGSKVSATLETRLAATVRYEYSYSYSYTVALLRIRRLVLV